MISRQIAKYQTNKKLIEFVDKLKATTAENTPHIHSGRAKETDENGNRLISCIGITLLDYTGGTGDNTVRVEANVSPEQCAWIYTILTRGDRDFNLSHEKIISYVKDDKGLSPVTKLQIIRAQKGNDGKERTHPWFVRIENGTGIAAKTATGGYMIQKNSYKAQNVAYINLNDADMFTLLHRVITYIRVWETKVGCELIRQRQLAN